MKQQMNGRWLSIEIAAVVALLGCSGSSYGQVRAARGSSALSGFGHVGLTNVSQGQRLYRERGEGPAGADVAGGNFVTGSPRGYGASSGGRYRPPSLDLFRPRQLGVYNALANPLNYSLARPVRATSRDYTGRNTWARARDRRFAQGYQQGQIVMALQAPRILLYQNAFLAPVWKATRGGRIRDALTNETLRNMPNAQEMALDDTVPRRSFSDLMQARLSAEIEKRSQDGWAAFLGGQYQDARTKFETVSGWQECKVEATLGMVFSALGTGQAKASAALAARLFKSRAGEVTDISVPPAGALPNPFLAKIDLQAMADAGTRIQEGLEAIGNDQNSEAAKQLFDEALELLPGHQDFIVASLIDKGRKSLKDDQGSQAGLCFKQVLGLVRDHQGALDGLTTLELVTPLLSQGREVLDQRRKALVNSQVAEAAQSSEEAARLFEQALALVPGHRGALKGLAELKPSKSVQLSDPPEPIPWNERTLDELVNEWKNKASASKEVDVQAVNVLLLWYAGKRGDAQSQAEYIQQEFRASPFAGMADAIREALDAEKSAEDQQTAAAAQPTSDS